MAFPLPFAGVVFSLGIMGMYFSGLLLPPKYAFFSQTAHLLLGVAGLPVFANFGSGVGVLAGPTGGFILAYPVSSFVIALILQKKAGGFLRRTFSMAIGTIVLYTIGIVGFCFYAKTDFFSAAMLVAVPFIPFDAVKIFACAAITGVIKSH
jgi:biotin transport system substrate-specific component